MKNLRLFLVILFLCLNSLPIQANLGFLGQNKHVVPTILTEMSEIVPGEEFFIGVHFKLEEGWHIYWKNVGDTGLKTKLTFDLPEGIQLGEALWPVPERFKTESLVSFGYHDEVMLMVPLTLDPKREWGESLKLKIKASWLECKTVCQPGRASIEKTIAISKNNVEPTVTNDKVIFDKFKSLVPQSSDENEIYVVKKSSGYVLALNSDRAVSELTFFPYEKDVISYKAEQKIQSEEGLYFISLEKAEKESDFLEGVLRVVHGNEVSSYQVKEKVLSEAPAGYEVEIITSSPVNEDHNFWGAILFAFIGGLILNIMPCVLPVLSVKILQILSHSGDDRRKILMNAWSYTFGVLASFWLLAGVLMGLRQAGQELGWGFQMQSPGMLMILMAVFFIFGLNLFGVFEIGVGLVGVDQKAKKHSGLFGAFLSGVLATVAATPCTAPYMGTALAFAITQPFLEAMAVFTGLGLGMASPFIVAGFFPGLMKLLPKPGAWMETFKQFLGFLLMATVAYLFYVYTTVVEDQERVLWMGICLVFLSMAAWVWGKWSYAGGKATWISRIMTFVLMGIGFSFASHHEKSYEWVDYDAEALANYLESGDIVFLDFTASWCLSCKVNEKTVLETHETDQLFKDKGIIPMKADWSRYSPEITQALEKLGRNSVPVYVIYDPKQPDMPILLPEVLTHGIIKEAILEIKP